MKKILIILFVLFSLHNSFAQKKKYTISGYINEKESKETKESKEDQSRASCRGETGGNKVGKPTETRKFVTNNGEERSSPFIF